MKNIQYTPLFKMLFILVIVLLLLIPKFMIRNLIREREYTRAFSIESVTAQWSNKQTLIGPIVSVPYYRYVQTKENSKVKKIKEYMYFLPEILKAKATIIPKILHKGIYEVVVYNAAIAVSGSFDIKYRVFKGIAPEDILVNEAFVSLGLSDLRGVDNIPTLVWNNKHIAFEPGLRSNMLEGRNNEETPLPMQSGITTNIGNLLNNTHHEFSFELMLKGSNELKFVPAGKITELTMNSTWQAPNFIGNFLPDTREISKDGFSAFWKVLHLNRNFPQTWTSSKIHANSIYNSAFGTQLFLPVDNYQKSTRAVTYAILFIVLTFLTFLFIELLNNRFVPIHPIQYILVGLALLLFHALLLAISEHLGFNIAFILASITTILLITTHMHILLKLSRVSILIASILSILYGFVFVIIQLEDFALLTGAIGLFIILAIVMHFARKINWYTIGMEYEKIKQNKKLTTQENHPFH